MDVFTMVVLIVVAVTVGEMYKAHKKNQNKGERVDTDRLEAEIAALKERVKSLETIVTDSTYQLRSEIDNLK